MPPISISKIDVAGRLRALDGDQVEVLAKSMSEIGIINPITVWPTTIIVNHIAADGYGLVAGLHRLKAAEKLGWTEIEAHIVDLPDLKRQLVECDENLCGTKLSKAERAMFTKRRKDIYIALHPETRNGAFHGNQHKSGVRKDCEDQTKRFTSDTAAKTGKAERTIQLDVARGEKIDPQVLAKVSGTKLDTGRTLDELASVPKDEQPDLLEDIARRKTAKAARLLAEEEAKEVRKLNSAENTIVEDKLNDEIAEYLCERLAPEEAHTVSQMALPVYPKLGRAMMRTVA